MFIKVLKLIISMLNAGVCVWEYYDVKRIQFRLMFETRFLINRNNAGLVESTAWRIS